MALPNPNPGGQAGAAVIPFPGGGGGGGGAGAGGASGSATASSVKSLVALTKDMVNVQKNILNVLNIIDTRLEQFIGDPSEKREVKDTAEGVSAEKLNWKDIMGKAGGFGNILGAALVAYVYDLDEYIRAAFAAKELFKPLVNGVKAAFRGIGTAFKALFNTKAFQTAIKPFTTAFDNFMAGFKNVGKVMGAVKTPVAIKEFKTVFGKIGATIGTIVKPLITVFGKIGATIGTIVKPLITGFKAIGNFFKPLLSVFKFLGQLSGITSTVKNAGGLFSKIMPILKGIGSKLLLPLFAIFDFVTGFIKGFASKGEGDTRSTMERLLDGLAGGFIKMIKGIFIVPLDLLKDGVEWIARQMGFEKFADALGTFSFDETFDKLIKFGKNLFSSEPEEGYFSIVKFMADKVQGVKDWFDTLMTDPVKALKELASGYLDIITSPAKFIWDKLIKPAIEGIMKMFGKEVELPSSGGIGDMINNFFKKILRAILPTPNDNAKWYDIPNLISKAIPDDVYKFAGLDPKTGEIVIDDTAKVEAFKASTKEPGLKPEGAATGELSKDVAAKKEGGGGTTVVDQSQKSGDVVTQKSSTIVAKDNPNARKSNPASGKIK